jgi:acyl-coenzyme A thioesterase PaaI-like protein
MSTLALPHTPGCLVCGRDNPHGLHLNLEVDPDTGIVQVQFTPTPNHIGFQGIVHGGIIGTVIDEAMVWAATWNGKRFCLCGEMTVRFRNPAKISRPIFCTASVDFSQPRLISTNAMMRDEHNTIIAAASGKYVPLDRERNREFVATVLDDVDQENQVAAMLRAAV